MSKRICDILLSIIIISILFIPSIFIWLAIKLTSSGPGFYWSERIGYKSKIFMMPKFRTMIVETPEIETNELLCSKKYITRIGFFLRRSSIDEIPQFLSVFLGDMSLVGPRPALWNQHELIAKRKKLKIDMLRPGITGWAQINGRDEISLSEKISLDYQYLQNQSLFLDLNIILKTIIIAIKSKNVIH